MDPKLVISVEANDMDYSPTKRWRERCDARMNSLKNKQFHYVVGSDSNVWFMSQEMYEAARDGDVDAFIEVLEALCEEKQVPLSNLLLCSSTPMGDTVIHVAAEFGRENIAELLAFHFPELATIRNAKGDTPLHVATRAKSLQIMKVILDRHLDSFAWRERCHARMTSLNSKFPVVGFNLSINIEEHVIMSQDMYEAAREGNLDVFLDMLEALCEEDKKPLSKLVTKFVTDVGDTVLHVAVKFGRESMAELLAIHFPELEDMRNAKGDTPFQVAKAIKNPQLLVDSFWVTKSNSSDPAVKITRIKNENGKTPLHEAVMSKHFDGVSLLLDSDKDVAHQLGDFNIPSPLFMAVETGDVNILHLLLSIQFPSHDPSSKQHQYSPLHAAILCRNPVMLEAIVKERRDLVDLRDEDGGSALHFAAHTGYVEGVRILLKEPTLEACKLNNKMNSPIHIACKMGHLDVVKELLRQEWPHPKILLNGKGRNILHIAAKKGKNNVVKYLLRNPKIDTAMVNLRDNDGNTPLHLASQKFCLWTLLALSRDKRVDVNSMNSQGLTAKDVILKNSSIPQTRQQFLCGVILGSAGVPLKANILESYLKAPHKQKSKQANTDWNVKDAASTLIIVGTLMATLTFAAGFTIPGGVYGPDQEDPRKRGMAVLAHETLFIIFMVFNTMAMYSSTLGSIILLWVQLGDPRFALRAYELAKLFVYLALITMPVAFLAAVRLVVSNNGLLADVVTVIGLIFIFFILFVRILGRFPLGTRLPLFRHVGELLIKIILILFYGRHDVVLNGKGQDLPNVGHFPKVGHLQQITKDY